MARVTHVKKAQQRYETKPVLDPTTGEQKRTPVMRGDGTQKTTKKGRLVFMDVTEADKDRPKPLLRCDFSGCTIDEGRIAIGSAYKHITPKSGPYGGTQKSRHAEHPTWQVWEYSSSLGARIAQIQHGFDIDSAENADDVQSALDSVAEEIDSLAEEKRESASSIEGGFGHPTSTSTELEEIADSLETWAEEVRSADIPEEPEPEEDDCDECGGSGKEDNPDYDPDEAAEDEDYSEPEEIDCAECDGSGTVTPEEPTEEQWDEWRESLSDVQSIVDESPV